MLRFNIYCFQINNNSNSVKLLYPYISDLHIFHNKTNASTKDLFNEQNGKRQFDLYLSDRF